MRIELRYADGGLIEQGEADSLDSAEAWIAEREAALPHLQAIHHHIYDGTRRVRWGYVKRHEDGHVEHYAKDLTVHVGG